MRCAAWGKREPAWPARSERGDGEMIDGKRIKAGSPVAPIDGELAGAPRTLPGSGDGSATAPMGGHDAVTATVPVAVSAEMKGSPDAGKTMSRVGSDTGDKPNASPASHGRETHAPSVTDGAAEDWAAASPRVHDFMQPAAEPSAESGGTGDVKEEDNGSGHEPTAVDDVLYDKVAAREKPSGGVRAVEAGGTNDALTGLNRKIKTLQDMIDTFEPLETDEQRKKRESREKSARIISAVSDGLRAMGNLFFTTRYAPDMYDHERSSQLNAQNTAIERARKEREANREAHLRFALALGDAENEREKTAREIEAERERRELARDNAQRAAEAHRWLAALQPDKRREQKGKADTAEQNAKTAEARATNAPDYYKKQNELLDAKKETEKKPFTTRRGGGGSRSGKVGGGGYSEWTAYDSDGKKHTYTAKGEAHAKNIADGNGWTISGYDATSKRSHGGTTRTLAPRTGGGVKTGKTAKGKFSIHK